MRPETRWLPARVLPHDTTGTLPSYGTTLLIWEPGAATTREEEWTASRTDSTCFTAGPAAGSGVTPCLDSTLYRQDELEQWTASRVHGVGGFEFCCQTAGNGMWLSACRHTTTRSATKRGRTLSNHTRSYCYRGRSAMPRFVATVQDGAGGSCVGCQAWVCVILDISRLNHTGSLSSSQEDEAPRDVDRLLHSRASTQDLNSTFYKFVLKGEGQLHTSARPSSTLRHSEYSVRRTKTGVTGRLARRSPLIHELETVTCALCPDFSWTRLSAV